ncbi:serine hydrolase [Aquimarina sp. AU58]|uniref:serine hydrolase domain-containing protein n=1 Tax=Aquimarina sp. AU58 TaxID=1874112 RepID=UPI000D6E572F|nr:serine hydrolase domain-containing protein [Aquimarina sp. AU58]
MKKICIISILVIVIPLLFYLLEPIFVHTSGWSAFPKITKSQPVVQHQDSISKKADSLLQDIFTRIETPAISVAVGKNGKIVWANAIGYEDIEKDKKVSLKTKFRIGSTSKAVTSIGLGVLLQNRKLSFDSKVKEFVPYASKTLSEITLRQLASHTSGIRNYGICSCFPIWEYYNNDEYATTKESVAVFNNDDLLFSPGTDFSYSTYNYTLLSAMIEGASEMDFPDFMKTSVFNPIGTNINIEKKSIKIKNLSKFYEVENNQYKEVYKVNNSNKWAGGGFIATPTDLVTLGNAFLNHKLLNKRTVQSLTQPVTLTNGQINEQSYAIGWRSHISKSVFKDNYPVQVFHHAGMATGATSIFVLFPEYNASISLLINKTEPPSTLFKYAYDLIHLFIHKP